MQLKFFGDAERESVLAGDCRGEGVEGFILVCEKKRSLGEKGGRGKDSPTHLPSFAAASAVPPHSLSPSPPRPPPSASSHETFPDRLVPESMCEVVVVRPVEAQDCGGNGSVRSSQYG
jgi:hypothetical protein